eukprot:GHUV01050280.1.p1 GENE.GHUV01050280.1~~GHUV01050280.1.p1  ORF type:complete len:128 (-),score=53.10 GHUV01050280.1:510-893(-)
MTMGLEASASAATASTADVRSPAAIAAAPGDARPLARSCSAAPSNSLLLRRLVLLMDSTAEALIPSAAAAGCPGICIISSPLPLPPPLARCSCYRCCCWSLLVVLQWMLLALLMTTACLAGMYVEGC